MADVLFILITIVFFVLCVGYVAVCDRIIGPDETAPDTYGDERELGGEVVGR
jgi:hypothetical protein